MELMYMVKEEYLEKWCLPQNHNPITLSEVSSYAIICQTRITNVLKQVKCITDPLPVYMTDEKLLPITVDIMTYMMSLITTVNLTVKTAQRATGYEREDVLIAFEQLEKSKYICRKRTRGGNGRVKEDGHVRYLLYPNADGKEYQW